MNFRPSALLLALSCATAHASAVNYPATPAHQDNLDPLLFGEFGRPDYFADSMGGTGGETVLRADDGVDNYFNETIVDKFRWLENIDPIGRTYSDQTQADRERNYIGSRDEDERPEALMDNRVRNLFAAINPNAPVSKVEEWVHAQNATTLDYITKSPDHAKITEQLQKFLFIRHNIQTIKNDDNEIEYYRDADGFGRIAITDKKGNTRVILNAKDLSPTGETSIGRKIFPSPKGTHIAFIQSSGTADSERLTLRVIDQNGKDVTPPVPNAEGEMDWADENTLYYIGKNGGWNEVRKRVIGKKSFYHDDIVIATDDIENFTPQTVSLESDGDNEEVKRYVIAEGYANADTFFIKDLKDGKLYRIHNQRYYNQKIAKSDAFDVHILAKLVHFDPKTRDVYFISGENNEKGQILKTNLDNLNTRTVMVDAPTAYDEIEKALLHEEGDGFFVIQYRKDGTSRVVLSDLKGNALQELTPDITGYVDTLDNFVYDPKDDKDKNKDATDDDVDAKTSWVSFRYQNAHTPRTVYKFSPTEKRWVDVRRRDLYPIDPTQFESKLVFVNSKDGTQVPMLISHKKGLVLNGKNPAIIYGYGGFGVNESAYFRPDIALWLEHGGVYAMPFLRGGNEYGDKWHQAGKRLNKMNVFDDLEASVDYLFAHGYSSPAYMSVTGASNGGLLAGAAMTLTPQKYRVAIPEVGVLDILRHNLSYDTQWWETEYGTAYDSLAQYKVLRSYSPYHNIKDGVCYPSTLVMTSRRDDRVSPSNSYKFVARLQEAQGCSNPTLLYAAKSHGHGPNTQMEKLESMALKHTFRLNQMNIAAPDLSPRPTEAMLKGEKWLKEDAKKKQRYEQNKIYP